jgi:hypothetical protein
MDETIRPNREAGKSYIVAVAATCAHGYICSMIKIAVTEAAYQAIAESLSEDARLMTQERHADGVWLWLDKATLSQMAALRRSGEDYSDVILRLAGLEAAQ